MEIKPASVLSIDEVAKLANIAFEGYDGVGRHHTGETLTTWINRHFITLERSYVFYDTSVSAEPVAFALMAVRPDKPRHVRLGAMGAVIRGQGHGYKALKMVEQEERKRGMEVIELECMHNNPAGLRLYTKGGYTILRELPGWETGVVDGFADDERLEELSLQEVQRVLKEQIDGEDVPWQLWDFATQPFAHRGFKLGEAYCAISDPEPPSPKEDTSKSDDAEDKKEGDAEAPTIKLASLFTLPSSRGQGQATRLAEAVMGRFPGHKWYAPAVFPREYGEGLSRKFGATELRTMLLQMRLQL